MKEECKFLIRELKENGIESTIPDLWVDSWSEEQCNFYRAGAIGSIVKKYGLSIEETFHILR